MATTTNLALRYPLPTDAPDGSGAVFNLAQDVEDRLGRTAATAAGLAAGTRYGQLAVVGTAIYRWNGTKWSLWDTEWQAFNPSGTAAAYVTPTAYTRILGGQALFEFSAQVNVQGNGQVTLANLPFPIRSGSQPIGNAFLLAAGGSPLYPLVLLSANSTTLTFNYLPGGSAASQPVNGQSAPIAWQGATLYVSARYATES